MDVKQDLKNWEKDAPKVSHRRPRKRPPRPGPHAIHGGRGKYMLTYRVLAKVVNRTNPNHQTPELIAAWEVTCPKK